MNIRSVTDTVQGHTPQVHDTYIHIILDTSSAGNQLN
jgi:hypothetical protein